MPKALQYYRNKLMTLRNVIDELLVEMDKDIPTVSTPQVRRNKKEEEFQLMELRYIKNKKRRA